MFVVNRMGVSAVLLLHYQHNLSLEDDHKGAREEYILQTQRE